MKTELLI
jgi:katanin p60 ATPase-containing subunit A1